jgi:hypothetical protein
MNKPNLQPVDPHTSATPPPDPFDLASLRLNPSFIETAGVKKVTNTIPVRKPNAQNFIRIHPNPEYRENFAVIELKDEREHYLVRPELLPHLSGEVVLKTFYWGISRQGVGFIWPIRLPAPDDRRSDWTRSAREAAEMAMSRWVRVKANMSLGAYEMTVADSEIADPVWPELSFQEIIRVAFKELMITSLDHPVIRRLRGQP